MAETYVNFLGGSPLNRLSWLRSSPAFLNAVAGSPNTRWLVFKNGHPLTESSEKVARLPTSDIQSLLGPTPYVGQGEKEGDIAPSDPPPVLEAARLRGSPLVFLGIHEPEEISHQSSSAGESALPSSDFSAKSTNADEIVAKIKGTPYFAVDVAAVEAATVEQVIGASSVTSSGSKLEFSEPRAAMGKMDTFEAALFAEARSMLDWNLRNKFCPGCGSSVYSLWAGWKLSCSSLLPWADNAGKPPCPSARGLHNFAHPRTDPVVIMCAIDPKTDKVLLGRNRKFPGMFYSALAGFMEPGESFEDAVAREMWEEAGVRVWGVRYHSGQPWPFPANLMVGFYAIADSTQPLRIDLDNELADARWYTRQEILDVLSHRNGTNITRRDWRTVEKIMEGKDNTKAEPKAPEHTGASALAHSDPASSGAVKGYEGPRDPDAPPFIVPPATAIAGVLIAEWAHGRVSLNSVERKGNL